MNRRPHSLSLAHGELQRAAQPIFSFRHRWSVLPLIIASSSFHHSTTTTTTTAPGLHQGMMSDFSLSGQLEHTRKTLKHPNSRSTSVERGEARYSPSRDYPTSAINQPPRLYSEFSRSDHSGFDHAMETQASYLQREDFYQDRKRYKVDNQLIAASTRHPNVTANRQSVSDNVVGQCDWDEESQTSYTQNEGYYQDRRRYEVVDDRFIAARTRQPNTTIHDMNMGPCVSNNAMARKPRSSEQSSAPINGNNPPLLPWRLCDEQRFSNHYGFGPGTNVEAPYPGKCNRDATRYYVGDVWKPTMACQASSSFQPTSRNYSLQRELSTYRSKPTPHLLWGPEDKQHLTELHCFVRKYCIYIFSATHQDIENPRKGRKTALRLGQIGIGCLHCKNSDSKLKGSTYFPTSLSGIYNATMIIQQRHFPVCPSVSREAFCTYNQLKTLTARSASTKEYWISSARNMGLYHTSNGVFFRSNEDPSATRSSAIPQQAARPTQELLVRLVEPSDKRFATKYAYFVMEQMTTCVFTESDRLGKRKCHKIGFPGMACRHCYGGNGSGRFFPLTLKTFSDVSKSIHVLRNHLLKCTKAPIGMAEKVSALSERHIDEKQVTPFGSQKTFFDLIWKRLHPELYNGVNDMQITVAPPPPLPLPPPPSPPRADSIQNPTRASPSSMRGPIFRDLVRRDSAPLEQDTIERNILRPEVFMSTTHTTTPLPPLASPPIVHRGKLSSGRIARLLNNDDHHGNHDDTRPSRQLCMIPKKRYLFSQRNIAQDEHQYYCQGQSRLPAAYPSSHPPPQQHVAVSYSESDVSIAMILANGFGKSDDEHREPNEANF